MGAAVEIVVGVRSLIFHSDATYDAFECARGRTLNIVK